MAKRRLRLSSQNLEFGYDKAGNFYTSGETDGAPNGTGVTARHETWGPLRRVTLTFTDVEVTVANTTGASFGSLKIYDCPEGNIRMMGGYSSFTFDWSGEDIAATGSGDYSLGTTATADATLATTDVDVQASTAMLDPFVAGVGTGSGLLAAPANHDGSSTAKDIYINIIIDDADVDDAASDVVTINGTVVFTYLHLGDI